PKCSPWELGVGNWELAESNALEQTASSLDSPFVPHHANPTAGHGGRHSSSAACRSRSGSGGSSQGRAGAAARTALDSPLLHGARKETPSMIKNTGRLVFAALLVAAAATTAFGQQTTGSIAGRVLDEQKAAVPGATITVKRADTGFT